MDENLYTRYEANLNKLYKEMENSPNPDEVQKKINEYMLDTLPYMEKIDNQEIVIETHPIFGNKISSGENKKKIYNEYLNKVENISTGQENFKRNIKVICNFCESSNIFIDYEASDYICGDCGTTEYYQSEELSYREEQETSEKVVTYSYKRDNHFNEWILQLQAQETTNIPKEVIEQLRSEFKKEKIKKLCEITPSKVRSNLKKLKLNKYYEHVPYITNILNGINPPQMTQELEEKLRQMFKEIQEPFNKHCPQNRKNFLSYSYVLYKFCELLEEDDFLPCFPLLKAKDKLYQQDVIWKDICNELKWEFISTI